MIFYFIESRIQKRSSWHTSFWINFFNW